MKTFAKIGAVAAVSVAALVAGAAVAQEVTKAADEAAAQAAVEERIELMKAIGAEMDKIAPMMRNQAPFDAAVVESAAGTIAELAPQIGPAFAVDTRDFGGLETDSRPNIWQSHDAFLEKAQALATAATALQEAAAGGERGPTMRAVGAVGQSCGSCHDDYQNS